MFTKSQNLQQPERFNSLQFKKPAYQQFREMPDPQRVQMMGISKYIAIPEMTGNSIVNYDKTGETLRALIRRYGGGNQIYIQNTSDYNINVVLDYSETKTIIVPSGSTILNDNIFFENITVKNLTASTITVGQITLYAIYQPDKRINITNIGGK